MKEIYVKFNDSQAWEHWKQVETIHEVSEEIEELLHYTENVTDIRIEGIQS